MFVRYFLFAGLILISFAGQTGAVGSSGHPATAPATMPIAQGRVYIAPPTDFPIVERSPDGRTIAFRTADGVGMLTMLDTPQGRDVDDVFLREHMGIGMVDRLAAKLKQANADIVTAPNLEDDARFAMRMRLAFRQSGQKYEQLHLYRGLGSDVVQVTATAVDASGERLRTIERAAELLILSARTARPADNPLDANAAAAATRPAENVPLSATPLAMPRAKLQIFGPVRWACDPHDAPSGTIATYTHPTDRSMLLTVSASQLPPEARTNATVRDVAVDDLLSGRQEHFQIGDGKASPEHTETIADARFSRKTRTVYSGSGERFLVTTRHVVVQNQTLATVTTLSTTADGATMEALGDRIAAGIRAAGR